MSIQERQNRPESLDRLVVQRLLYFKAKQIHRWRGGLLLLIGILTLPASAFQCSTLHSIVAILVLVTLLLDKLFLEGRETSLKTEAATIQEDFDCFVLGLPWPEHKGIQRPRPDRINQLVTMAERGKSKVSDGLEDWYTPAKIPDDPILAKIYCQKMSCWWDVNLRCKWRTVLWVIFGVFAFLALFLAVFTGITVAKFVTIAAAIVRIFTWVIDRVKSQSLAIDHVGRIHRYLSDLSEGRPVSPANIRSLQDEIFEHRRSNPPVPDWFYWKKREGQELEIQREKA